MANTALAIRYAEEHRETHAAWVEYWRENPPKTPEGRSILRGAGGIAHHTWAIDRYDTILAALREARDA